jgi:type II secretory pathway pseudopilin PulG
MSLFIEKLQQRNQTAQQQKQAAHAVSLYFQTQGHVSTDGRKQNENGSPLTTRGNLHELTLTNGNEGPQPTPAPLPIGDFRDNDGHKTEYRATTEATTPVTPENHNSPYPLLP